MSQEVKKCEKCNAPLSQFHRPGAALICINCQQLQAKIPQGPKNLNPQDRKALGSKIESKKANLAATFRNDQSDISNVTDSPDVEEFLLLQKAKVRPFSPLTPLHYLSFTVLAIVACIGFLFYQKKRTQEVVGDQISALETKLKSQADYSFAKTFAEQYLNYQSSSEALADSLPDKTLEDAMETYWAPTTFKENSLQYQGLSYISNNFIIYKFLFKPPYKPPRKVFIFRSDTNEYYFDWRSFSGIYDLDIRDFSSLENGDTFLGKVKCESSSYYNFGYDETDWESFKLSHSNNTKSSDKKINAFAKADVADEIYNNYENGDRSLLLKFEKKKYFVEITDFVSDSPEVYYFNEQVLPLLEKSSSPGYKPNSRE